MHFAFERVEPPENPGKLLQTCRHVTSLIRTTSSSTMNFNFSNNTTDRTETRSDLVPGGGYSCIEYIFYYISDIRLAAILADFGLEQGSSGSAVAVQKLCNEVNELKEKLEQQAKRHADERKADRDDFEKKIAALTKSVGHTQQLTAMVVDVSSPSSKSSR